MKLTLKLWLVLIVLTALMLPVIPVGIGMAFEGYARHYEQIDICRKRAEPPVEYHRCSMGR